MPNASLPLLLRCVLRLRPWLRSRPTPAADDRPVAKAEMAGYLLVPHGKVDAKYNAGFSMYVAAWPLLEELPGAAVPERPVRHLDVRPVRRAEAEEALLRHRGRARLVAGHAVRHRDAEVHHGRRGPELQRVGERPRRRQGPRLEEARGPLRHRPAQPVGALAAGRPQPQAGHVRGTLRLRLPAAAAHRAQEDHRGQGRADREPVLDAVPEHRQLQGAGDVLPAVLLVAAVRREPEAGRACSSTPGRPSRTRRCRWRPSTSPRTSPRTRRETPTPGSPPRSSPGSRTATRR